MLENSSGSKFPIWLAEATFITEKKKNRNGLISELGKHQSQLLDDLKKLQCFWELSSIQSNVPKVSVFPNPPLSAVSECSAATLGAWATVFCNHSICIYFLNLASSESHTRARAARQVLHPPH